MSRPYDLTLKFLLQNYPQDVLGHLLGLPVAGPINPLETELRADVRTADALVQVPLPDDPRALVHLEVQTRYEAAMPLRMLDYAVRIYQRYQRSVHSWLLLLLPPTPGLEPIQDSVAWGTPPQGTGLYFRFGVVRIWDLAPEIGLQHPGLLPLVPLMRQEQDALTLLNDCAARIETWDPAPTERQNLLGCLGSLASLRYDKAIVRQWLGRIGMIETPFMEWLRAEGEAKALLTVLDARGLTVSEAQRNRIMDCTESAQLEVWLKCAVTAKSIEEVLGSPGP